MEYIGLLVTTLIGAWVGSFFGSYLKKKAENLATHEDLEKLIHQVAAVTQTTKEIEAKISNDVWDRQRRWEVKKDALFKAIEELGSVQAILADTTAVYSVKEHGEAGNQFLAQQAIEAYDRFNVVHSSFARAMTLAILVSGVEVVNHFNAVNMVVINIIRDAMNGQFAASTGDASELCGCSTCAAISHSEGARCGIMGLHPSAKFCPARIERPAAHTRQKQGGITSDLRRAVRPTHGRVATSEKPGTVLP